MKVKLKVPKVINGGVWQAGAVVDVPDDEARQLLDAEEAEVIAARVVEEIEEE